MMLSNLKKAYDSLDFHTTLTDIVIFQFRISRVAWLDHSIRL